MADPRLAAVEGVLIGLGPFAAGGMLLWGLVAAVPILLHLLRRRLSRTLQWGAMQFLRAAIARRAKQFQLWRLLLLCLRVAAVLAIAAALARPVLPGAAGDTAGRAVAAAPPTLWVFVIDASYSMRAVVDGQSRFELAQAAAADMARRAPAGDGFLLVKMSDRPETIIQTISYRVEETIAEIDALESEDGGADLRATIVAVDMAVDDAVRDGWAGPIEVILLSDLQETTWGAKNRSPQRPGSRRTAAAGEIRYRVMDMAPRPVRDNATVVRIERDASGDPADDTHQFLSTIEHTGGDPIGERLAQLVIDGSVALSQPFDLQPGDSRTLLWTTRLARGRHAVEVRIGKDALATDNIAGIVVDVSPTISVAAFGSSPAASRYLALAAAPGGDGSVEVRTFDVSQLPRAEIGRFDLWVLCDPPPLGREAERRIDQHLGQGGGVVWWLGPRWQAGRGGNAVDAGSGEAEPTAWTAAEIATANEPRIDPLDYRSEIVQPFESFPGAGLLSLPVFRYWILELGSSWQPGLAIGDAPLLATLETEGRGRQVLIATPPGPGIAGSEPAGGDDAAEAWNALIAWPSFVPLVQETIRWARADQSRKMAFLVGEPIAGQTPETEMGERLRNDAGDVLDVEVRSRVGRSVRWDAGIASSAGVYRWMGAGVEGGEDAAPALVVNVDPREGRLGKVVELPERFTRYDAESAPEEFVESAADEAGRAESTRRTDGREIFWWVLLAAGGLLIAESVVVRILEGRF